MAALPVQRLIPFRRPFTFVGVDYLGPVEVSVGRRREKRWIVVFTCMVIRAVHLEVAHSLSAQSCLMLIRRFISRRGPATEYFSDNGTNFRGASREMLQQIRSIDHLCAHEFTNAITSWHFNPPATPHMGGVWERMVRSVKSVMAALDDGRKHNDEILLTTLAETEDIINSRPLTDVSSDSECEALSPNTFLRGSNPNEPQEVVHPTNQAEALRDSSNDPSNLQMNNGRGGLRNTFRLEGDLVYVVEGSKRKAWVRGVVEQLIVSKDGRIRQVFKQGVANLAVLEIEVTLVPNYNPGLVDVTPNALARMTSNDELSNIHYHKNRTEPPLTDPLLAYDVSATPLGDRTPRFNMPGETPLRASP
ncbi:uncharacterized protein LOC129737760 [Uranotaenia lowii]|uniref:uncharacterized protein LOC129737760 n=1 Tax=Uranotaenia lowii TaxID=190385 RepID=UPI002479394C|nr:uncharacterized protein LOC129737760 [Uranotaenia lowii]